MELRPGRQPPPERGGRRVLVPGSVTAVPWWRRIGAHGSSLSYRMSFTDFCRNYSRVEVCTLTPDAIEDDTCHPWSVTKFDGSWRKGSTAGGCRNNACEWLRRIRDASDAA